mgnify:CR=1
MGIIITIATGALIGWLASMIAKTNDQMGCIWNIGVGIAGSALGNWIATMLFDNVELGKFSIIGLLIGVGGAFLLLTILKAVGVMKKDK